MEICIVWIASDELDFIGDGCTKERRALVQKHDGLFNPLNPN